MTGAQCRAARELLGWSEQDLAVHALCSSMTVRNLERRAGRPHRSTILAIRRAVEEAGVELTDGEGPGVKLQQKSS